VQGRDVHGRDKNYETERVYFTTATSGDRVITIEQTFMIELALGLSSHCIWIFSVRGARAESAWGEKVCWDRWCAEKENVY